ncbi:hypothetical protein MesoLjLc_77230 [Mesorhizobium sp. L-8-10]|uniref:TVP38/TMEM64 family protein n=1 Tax=unclassified Mesorhizobium TaxID=325217 RepID=UPI0019381E0D|nr:MULTISPECIES: VTT domain-containing protein [unclassified Mesorhizobium]BCH27899.1 hypothetical protein MesoLjLb_76840 [Mesorhizobium sp. L-8-3]BCH35793.1 hypothetical protein MesoLjLc_77230 [Mesorhizobium sp. L-8-10]
MAKQRHETRLQIGSEGRQELGTGIQTHMNEVTAHVGAGVAAGSGDRWRLRRFLPIGVIAAVIAVAYARGWYSQMSLASVAESRDALQTYVDRNYLLSLAGFVAFYVIVTAASVPIATMLTILGGGLFGWLVGGLSAAVGATVGAALIFLAARSACGTGLRGRVAGFADRLACGFESNAFGYLLVLRLAPFIPFCVVNVAPALFKVRPRTFVAATAIGILPGAFAYASLGNGLDSVVEAAQRAGRDAALSDLVTPEIVAALACLTLIALVAVVIRVAAARRAA